MRDSASIQIIENPDGDTGAPGVTYLTVAQPALRIGMVDGDSLYQLYSVWGAQRLPGGGVVVMINEAAQLRFFDSAGRFIRTVGRAGDGPGEFSGRFGPDLICRSAGDSIAAVAGAGRVVSFFDTAGTYGRRIAVPPLAEGNPLFGRACSSDGAILGQTPILVADPQPGSWRDSVVLAWVNPDGSLAATIGRFPARERQEVGAGEHRHLMSVPWSPQIVSDAGPGEAYVGLGESYEIRVYGRDGRLRRIIRRALQPVPITDSMIRAHKARAVAEIDRMAARTGRPATPGQVESYRYPKTLPPYSDLLVGVDGRLWVQRYSAEPSSGQDGANASRWDVFDRGGRWRAIVDFPSAFTLMDADADYALGVWRNADGVEFIHLYPLEPLRSSANGSAAALSARDSLTST